ncbi:MAG: helix-turn-helix domain-containing protein [Streptosporangiales bacterium]|nr:helix-turn-helix domain-containing protein [Streptosporangiales bacterium]
MSVGRTLAEARNRAGLSVDELGQRTKIREQVIRAIEQDDFDACGGTLYVRGYVRVIAGAVGVNAQPLLQELDRVGGVSGSGGPPPTRPALRPQAPRPPAPQPPRPAPGPATPVSGGWGAPPTPVPPTPSANDRFSRLERLKRLKEAEDAQSRAAGAAKRSGPFKAIKRSGPIKVTRDGEPEPAVLDLTRAAQPSSADLSRAGTPETLVDMMKIPSPDEAPPKRNRKAARAEAPPVTEAPPGDVVPGLDSPVRETSFDLPALSDDPPAYSGSGFGAPPAAGGGPGLGAPPAPPRPQERRPFQPPPAQGRPGGGSGRGRRKGITALVIAAAVIFVIYAFSQMFSGGGGPPAPAAGPSAASPSGPTGLTVSQCQAWGPNGTADGDNPTTASYPITPGAGQPWITQQYSTAQFGGQKSGSGLLLDMGKTVTVSGVSVDLGSTSGAGLELQAGNSTSSLASVSTVTNVSGNVQIRPGKPVTARYLLIWFNQLPQASDGQYQASVYHVSVQGTP